MSAHDVTCHDNKNKQKEDQYYSFSISVAGYLNSACRTPLYATSRIGRSLYALLSLPIGFIYLMELN